MGAEAPSLHWGRPLVAETVVEDADRANGWATATMRTTASADFSVSVEHGRLHTRVQGGGLVGRQEY